ncbi:MAG: hypothetical protein IKZ21_06490 [Clostridia bacterium]|nr:hypothetical protein [Clostridia bacterium]
MANKFFFGNGSDKKQKPAVNNSPRIDYSIPMESDSDFLSSSQKDPDPLRSYSLRILRGRAITWILSFLNIALLTFWMIRSYLREEAEIWWLLGYGLLMIVSCIFMLFGREFGRKVFALPGVILGIPLVFSLMVSPSSFPVFLKTSYQIAFQVISTALLYFLPCIRDYFEASPKARERAYNREWEKNPPEKD